MDEKTRTEIEAAAFRRVVAHLQQRTDVRDAELNRSAGFCREDLARWYAEAAHARDIALQGDEARQRIYGMTHAEWTETFER